MNSDLQKRIQKHKEAIRIPTPLEAFYFINDLIAEVRRLESMPRIPNADSSPCKTTHHACECMIKSEAESKRKLAMAVLALEEVNFLYFKAPLSFREKALAEQTVDNALEKIKGGGDEQE